MSKMLYKFLKSQEYFKSLFSEPRPLFRSGPETGGEGANTPTATREREQRITERSRREAEALSARPAEEVATQDPADMIIERLEKTDDTALNEPAKQTIFDTLLDQGYFDTTNTAGEVHRQGVDLSKFSETQFFSLLKISTETLGTKKAENLNKIFAKIENGTFGAEQLSPGAMKQLLEEWKSDTEKTKILVQRIAESPTRLSQLIMLFSAPANIPKLKELLKNVPNHLDIIKQWLTNKDLSNYFSVNALATLIDNDIFPIDDFLQKDFINKLTFKTKIALAKTLQPSFRRERLLKDHIRKNLDKVIQEDSTLVDALLAEPDIKNNILHELKLLLKKEEEYAKPLTQNTVIAIINEYYKTDAELMKILFKNIDQNTKNAIIDNIETLFPALSEDDREKILIALNPLIGKAIEKFKLKRVNGEYRRLRYFGKYYFLSSAPDKVYYKNPSGIQSCKIDTEGENWRWESYESSAEVVKSITGDCTKVSIKPNKKTYANENDNAGTDSPAGTQFEIVQPLTIVTPPESNATLQGIPCIKVKTMEEPPKELLVKLHDVTPWKEIPENFGQDFVTTETTILSNFGRPVRIDEIPAGEKLALMNGSKIQRIEGREYVQVKWLKKGLTGLIDTSFLAKMDPPPTLEGEKAREIYEDYCIAFDKVEATERSLPTGVYHTALAGGKAFLPKGDVGRVFDELKFTISDGKIYKITRTIPNEDDPRNPIVQEFLVVKFEDTKSYDNRPQEPKEGYVDINSLIQGDDKRVQTPPEFIKYAESEWSKTPEYAKDKKVPTDKYAIANANTFIFGFDPTYPERAENVKLLQNIKTTDAKVRIVQGKEYVKVKTTLKIGGTDQEIEGWIALSDTNISEAEVTLATDARAEEIEREVERTKKDEVLDRDPDNSSGFVVNFKYKDGPKTGKINKTLEAATKINDIFPTSENGDTVEIIPKKHPDTKIIAEFKDGLYYIKQGEKVTSKRAVIFDGDKIEFKPKRGEKIDVTEMVDGNPDVRMITFKSGETGPLNRGLEQSVKLTDIFTNIQEGDQVIITPAKGKGATDIAEYRTEGEKGATFYYTTTDASKRKLGSRAVIFNGDKVELVRQATGAPEGKDYYGTFQLPKEEMTERQLMKEIYKIHPKLETELIAAGVSEHTYYQQIIATKTRDSRGSHIYILKPEKTFESDDREYQQDKSARQWQRDLEDSAENQRILRGFGHYYEDEFKIHKSLLDYVNDDKRWNDLWTHNDNELNKYIDGIEEVITIMRDDFGLDEFKIRATLRDIVQEGYNDHVDFEDVFEALAKPLYFQLKQKYGEEIGFMVKINTYKDFKADIEKTKLIIEKWEKGENRDKFARIETFRREEAAINRLEAKAKKEGRLNDFHRTARYKAFEKQRASTQAILTTYQKEYAPASKRLSILVKTILVPTAKLLDAIEAMRLGVSNEMTAYQTYNNDMDSTQEVAATEIPEGTPPYYDLGVLTTSTQGELPQLSPEELGTITEEGKEKYAVTISKAAFDKFRKIAESSGLNEAEQNSFSEDQMLKLIFQLYSVQTLVEKGCLNKVKGKENYLLLTNLPDNFKVETPAVKDLFSELKTSANIDTKQALIKKTAEILDNNRKILGKLAAIYGKDSPKIHLLWTEWLKRVFTGEDRRTDQSLFASASVTLNMEDIGEGSVTLPMDFFADHMSGEAAQNDILGEITTIEDGITTLDETKLKTILSMDLEAGINSLPMFANNIPDLTKFKRGLEDTYGAKLGLNNIEDGKLYAYLNGVLENYLSNPTAVMQEPDNSNILTLIKIGHVFNVINKTYEKIESETSSLILSDDPVARPIQEAWIAQREKEGRPPLTQDELNKIEHACLFGVGLVVGTSGGTGGAGIGKAFEFEGGLTVSAGAGLGQTKGAFTAGAGASVEKTFTLSDGKTQITVGVDAGYPYVGGHVGTKFRISDKASMGITGVGGWIPGGFYAGGVISFHHEPEWEREAETGKETIKLGYDLVDKMIADDYPEKQIATTIMLLPDVGKDFARLRQEYKLTDKIIIELYEKQRAQVGTQVTKGIKTWAGGMGGGIGFVWVQIGKFGLPIPNLYIDIPLGTGEVCIVRTNVQGQGSLDRESQEKADAQILAQLRQRYGTQKLTFLQDKVENEGQFIYDAETGQAAVLKGKESINFGNYDHFNQLNKKLNAVGVNLVPDKKSGLTRIEVPNTQGNTKFLIDPEIREQLVIKNGEVYLTLGETKTDLIFEKENFSYPYKYDGATTLSVITIKRNPARTRDEIEKESPVMVYQRPGFQPEIRKGLRKTALRIDQTDTPAITTYDTFKAQPADTEHLRDAEKAEQMNAKYEEFLAISGVVKERETPREKIVPEFAEAFLADPANKLAYKKLSTRLVKDFYDVAKTQNNNKQLNELINKFAESYPPDSDTKLGKLHDAEMQQVLTYLMTQSFMKLPEKRKETVFKHNLETFGRKYLTEFFKEAKGRLESQDPKVEIRTSPDLMAQYVINDLKKVDLTNPRRTAGLEKMGLLSLVGTDGVVGLRGTPTYGTDMASGILELTKYSPTSANRIKSDIGKVIIEIASPLDTSSDEKFMKSPLSVKMLAHPGMFLILGPEDAMKVAQCFKDGKVESANRSAFDKFKRIILAIRAAQNSGQNFIEGNDKNLHANDMPKDYRISVNPETSIGVYEKCGNPTMAFDEGIAIFIPKTKGLATKTQSYTRVNADARIKYNTFRLGIALIVEAGSTPPDDGKHADDGAAATEDTPPETPPDSNNSPAPARPIETNQRFETTKGLPGNSDSTSGNATGGSGGTQYTGGDDNP